MVKLMVSKEKMRTIVLHNIKIGSFNRVRRVLVLRVQQISRTLMKGMKWRVATKIQWQLMQVLQVETLGKIIIVSIIEGVFQNRKRLHLLIQEEVVEP